MICLFFCYKYWANLRMDKNHYFLNMRVTISSYSGALINEDELFSTKFNHQSQLASLRELGNRMADNLIVLLFLMFMSSL